jgi:hypothetical protein
MFLLLVTLPQDIWYKGFLETTTGKFLLWGNGALSGRGSNKTYNVSYRMHMAILVHLESKTRLNDYVYWIEIEEDSFCS